MGVAVVIALVAAVLAVWFWFQGQSAASAVKGLQDAAEASRKEAEVARAEQKKAEGELKARAVLLQETREKLAEARKKSQEGKPKVQQPRGAREAELEEDLVHARKLSDEAHAAETAARRDLASARLNEAQARNELATAQAKVRELAARPVAAQAAAPVAVEPKDSQLTDELVQQRTQLEAARSELDRQVQQAEKNAREAKRRELELRDEVRKMRGRAETNNRVYLVTKGELEVTKERLALAERKLWLAGIPLAPPASKERPKATGPAAAERKAEEGAAPAADAPAGEPISSGETAEATSAAEAASAPEGAGAVETSEPAIPPGGVAPIRRRPAESAADKTQG